MKNNSLDFISFSLLRFLMWASCLECLFVFIFLFMLPQIFPKILVKKNEFTSKEAINIQSRNDSRAGCVETYSRRVLILRSN